MQKTLVVTGGGAAGFFCAVNAARLDPSLKVILIEKSNKLLSKVKVSGGGRCNVTHACFDITEVSRKYPRGGHFVRKAFHQFFVNDTIRWFEDRGVRLKAEPDGRMFPVTDSSRSIIDCLLREANRYNVEIRMHAELVSLVRHEQQFHLALADGREIKAHYLCIACGGFPKASMFDWIRQAGHTIEDPVPSLYTFNLPADPVTRLMGVSVGKVQVKIAGSKLEDTGPLLVTHWGFSGPVILRLSAWGARELKERNWTFEIKVNWLPEYNENTLREKFQILRQELASRKFLLKNPFGLPNRLWEQLGAQGEVNPEVRWADLPGRVQHRMIELLTGSLFHVKGKTTFREEFVTAGGVKLSEIDPNTMMSRKIPHLYFAGEIMDVDGITGGFNFQNAWTSGYIAAKHIAEDHLSN